MNKLFLDFDNVITSSTEVFCKVYNILYQAYPDFIHADWTKVNEWNFSSQCTLLKSDSDVLEIFEDQLFFDYLKFINDNTYDVIKSLNDKYKIIIVTIGTPTNLAKKAKYLHEKLPFIKDYVLLYNETCEMCKQIVKMDYPDSVFIDDVTSNLDSSNAKHKIIFGKEYPWSQTNGYKRCFNWSEVEKLLL